MATKNEQTRVTVTAGDTGASIAAMHRAWRRDMARALGAVDTAKAAVESMEATRKVNQLLAGVKP